MKWFQIDRASGRITGTVESSNATAIPADTEALLFREMSEEDRASYFSLEKQALQSGRRMEVLFGDAGPYLPEDARPIYRIEAPQLAIDIADELPLTVTCIDAGGDVRADYSGPVLMRVDDRLLSLQFEDGVATKSMRGGRSGVLNFASVHEYRVEQPLQIVVTE